jgi:hypothetical protein
LPWKISVKGGACAIAAGDAPLGAPLTVIFARRHDARREEDGPVALAGAVTKGGVTAGTAGRRVRGNGGSGSGPRRCAER